MILKEKICEVLQVGLNPVPNVALLPIRVLSIWSYFKSFFSVENNSLGAFLFYSLQYPLTYYNVIRVSIYAIVKLDEKTKRSLLQQTRSRVTF